MIIAAKIMAGLVAVEHIYILVLEMFLWEKPIGLRTFGMTAEQAATSAKLAMNQGLYNGFLAAGIFWALFLIKDANNARAVQLFFLGCVIVAGIFGGITAKTSILYTQGLPALIAFILTYLANRNQ